jgi:rhamnose utilization protein RhaD (predicted bifunctional aldolase and dehydrogenase)
VRPQEAAHIGSAIEAALENLDVLKRHAQDVADAFRESFLADARRGLDQLVRGTKMLLSLAAAVASATGTDLAKLCRTGAAHPDEDMRTAIDLVVTHQLAEDWAALSDTLEHDFTAALDAWRVIFEVLDGEPPVQGPDGWAA